jgi:hypothetical protein
MEGIQLLAISTTLLFTAEILLIASRPSPPMTPSGRTGPSAARELKGRTWKSP